MRIVEICAESQAFTGEGGQAQEGIAIVVERGRLRRQAAGSEREPVFQHQSVDLSCAKSGRGVGDGLEEAMESGE